MEITRIRTVQMAASAPATVPGIPVGAKKTPGFGTMRFDIVRAMARPTGVLSSELFEAYPHWDAGHIGDCVSILRKQYGYTIDRTAGGTFPATQGGGVDYRWTIPTPAATDPTPAPGNVAPVDADPADIAGVEQPPEGSGAPNPAEPAPANPDPAPAATGEPARPMTKAERKAARKAANGG